MKIGKQVFHFEVHIQLWCIGETIRRVNCRRKLIGSDGGSGCGEDRMNRSRFWSKNQRLKMGLERIDSFYNGEVSREEGGWCLVRV